ncbi:polysaccharide biosynthesis protein [Mobilitalea sibirica]|uniref:Polysaccharide biosynthesis protein n=1 Tax=Mobilitalea sibirica TaxID=1462919 RepID=A0A8J7KRJ8_9FIRM|nr:PssD/Cps14F family polysaccharide biosynthesis glycosyltransferase [Mobilitalea sibirica]MBH1939366.1 polysaccharide biosynthesis protein [Mobilitalea sibirica]
MYKKICFAASSGGHYEQLMMLKPIMDEYDSFIVTEKTKYSSRVDNIKSFYLLQINRKEIRFIPKIVFNSIKSLVIILKEKPNVVITTGVLAVIPICLLVKLLGGKLIYIESFAKVSTPTETGKLLYKFADQFYVQWDDMIKVFPKAIYKGGIY